MKNEYREKSTYEYILNSNGENIIEPEFYSIYKQQNINTYTVHEEPLDEYNGYNSYYTYTYVHQYDDYQTSRDIISCAYSFVNLSSYIDSNNNEQTLLTIKDKIAYSGAISIYDAGFARIKTDFYENTYYYTNSTYYTLKSLYPTNLSFSNNLIDYFKEDQKRIKAIDIIDNTKFNDIINNNLNDYIVNAYNTYNNIHESTQFDDISEFTTYFEEYYDKTTYTELKNSLTYSQIIDCTETFDSNHDIVTKTIFIRYPDSKYIDYKVNTTYFIYNQYLSPNYFYRYKLSNTSYESKLVSIFNSLTGTLSLNSEYITNNSYCDLYCRVLKENENFFQPKEINLNIGENYYGFKDYENDVEHYYQYIPFRYYFQKLLPMKYELVDNTYVVYLNEVIENNLYNKKTNISNEYSATKVTITLDASITYQNIKIQDLTNKKSIKINNIGNNQICFDGIYGNRYSLSLINTSKVIRKIETINSNNNDEIADNIYSQTINFIITRHPNDDSNTNSIRSRCKAIVVNNILIGTQTPPLPNNINDDSFKSWIEANAGNINIENIKISVSDKPVSPVIIEKKNISIQFSPNTQRVNINQNSISLLSPKITIANTNTALNLVLKYSSSNNSIVQVINNKLKLNGLGTATITATFSGNNTYNAASSTYEITVYKTVTPNTDTEPEPPSSSDPKLYIAKSNISIYDLAGGYFVSDNDIWKNNIKINQDQLYTIDNFISNNPNYRIKYSIQYSTNNSVKIIDRHGDGNNQIQANNTGTASIICILAKINNNEIVEIDSKIISLYITIKPIISKYYLSIDFVVDGIHLNSQSFKNKIHNITHTTSNTYYFLIHNVYIYFEDDDQQQWNFLGTENNPITICNYSGGIPQSQNPRCWLMLTSGNDQSNTNVITKDINGQRLILQASNSSIKKLFSLDYETIEFTGYVEGEIYTTKDPSIPVGGEDIKFKIEKNNFHIDNENIEITFFIQPIQWNEDEINNLGAKNPYSNDDDLNINILNEAYSKSQNIELESYPQEIIYGEGENEEDNDEETIIEEFGEVQIEEMPELYLPKDLNVEIYRKIKYSSSNRNIAQIVYYAYNINTCDETIIIPIENLDDNITDDDIVSKLNEYAWNEYEILKPKLLIKSDGKCVISVEYPGDDIYGLTTGLSFNLVVKLKGTPQLSLDEYTFEIERQLASAVDEAINYEDPLSGFQIFQSPTPNVTCEETIPIAFEYTSSNDLIGTPYADLGDIIIFDVGTLKITIKLKETAKYHSATISYQLVINNPPTKTETILNVEQAYYQIRYSQYIDKPIYRVYDYYVNPYDNHLVLETNSYNDIEKIQNNIERIQKNNNITEYKILSIRYIIYYKNSNIVCTNLSSSIINNYPDLMNFEDPLNGNCPILDFDNIEYNENYSEGKVRLNCYVVLDEFNQFGYYIFSKGLTNRLKTDSNNFIKGEILGTYIDKHLKILMQQDSLGLLYDSYPTYSENFETYGMQIINEDNPQQSKAYHHVFKNDMDEYLNSKVMCGESSSCQFYVKISKITNNDYDWKKQLMLINDFNDEDLNYPIFKTKYTSNNTDEDVEYIFSSSIPSIANTNSNGDVVIYKSGKVKITIRSTETENFTSGETAYILDILEKEIPMLETKYNKYLYEMDETLVENVFGRPDFEWNNTDPDAKLVYWLRNGGSDTDPDSYVTDKDLENLGLIINENGDDNNGDDNNNNNNNNSNETQTEPEPENPNWSVYVGIGEEANLVLGYASNELKEIISGYNSDVNIDEDTKTIYITNCYYRFIGKGNGNNIIDPSGDQYNVFVNNYLKISNPINFISNTFGFKGLQEYVFNQNFLYGNENTNDKIIQNNVISYDNINNKIIIKFKLDAYPVFNLTGTNLGYFLPDYFDEEETNINGEIVQNKNIYHSDRSKNSNSWYIIDNLYKVGNGGALQCYSNSMLYCYIPKSDDFDYRNNNELVFTLTQQELENNPNIYNQDLRHPNPPTAVKTGSNVIYYYFLNKDYDNTDNNLSFKSIYSENDSPSIVYNINGEDDLNSNNIVKFQKKQNNIIYGAKPVLKSQFINPSIIIEKDIISYDENGNQIQDANGVTVQKGKFEVSVDEAGNVTIQNGLIGHVINVLVKSVETDNFKPKYLVYNIVVRSILDHNSGENGEESKNGGYSVTSNKKINTVEMPKKRFDVRVNPNSAKEITFECPEFSCANSDQDLQVKYYIFYGNENGEDWYASHYFKEFTRPTLKNIYDNNNEFQLPLSRITDLINGQKSKTTTLENTLENNTDGQIINYTISGRYGTKLYKNDNQIVTNSNSIDPNNYIVSIDDNGKITIKPNEFCDKIINVMIYFSETSSYYDNCIFYNINVLQKYETVITFKDNVFSVPEPYPVSSIFELPEIKTNNTDTDEIKYYITARQVDMVDHDPFTYSTNKNWYNENTNFDDYHNDKDTKWKTTYGHYADDEKYEKDSDSIQNNEYNEYPKYDPISLHSIIKNGKIIKTETETETEIEITYPCEILDGPDTVPNSKLLFKLYKNGQIKYQNSAGRYVLNVCVISEETTNFLQGYGFYNLEVEVKPEPTLGIYPPEIEVKVGTEDVYLQTPEIITSNTDESCIYTYEIYPEEQETQTESESPQQYEGDIITIDDVGTIKIKGGLFEENEYINEENVNFWIKVITSPTENFCSTSEKFLIKIIKKELPVLVLNPNYIEIKHNPDNQNNHDKFIELPDIICSNTDDNHKFIFNEEIETETETQTESEPGLVIENGFKNAIITLKANAQLGSHSINVTSIETENFQELTKQFTINVIEKETTIVSIYPNTLIVRTNENDQYINLPNIKHNNTDPNCKLNYVLPNDMPNENISIDDLNNMIFIKGNTDVANYYIGINSNETENFLGINSEIETQTEPETEPETETETQTEIETYDVDCQYKFLVSIQEKIEPTISINGDSSEITLTRTVTVGSEIFASLPIEHDNTDSDAKIIYISSDTSVFTITSQGALVVYKNGSADLTVKIPETENFKEATQTITINIVQQTIPSDAFYGDDDYNGNNDDPGGNDEPTIITVGDITYDSNNGDTYPNPPDLTNEDATWMITSNFDTNHKLPALGNSSSTAELLGTISNIPQGYHTPQVAGIWVNDSETETSMLQISNITIKDDNNDGTWEIKGIVLNNRTSSDRLVRLYFTMLDASDQTHYGYIEIAQEANESISIDDSNWPSYIIQGGDHDGDTNYNGVYKNGVLVSNVEASSGVPSNCFWVSLGGNAKAISSTDNSIIIDMYLQNTINDVPKEQGGDYYRQPVIKVTNNDKAVTLSNLTITDGYEADLRRNDNYQSISSFTFSVNYSGTGVYVYCPHINAGDNSGKFINFTLSNEVSTVNCHIRIIHEDSPLLT